MLDCYFFVEEDSEFIFCVCVRCKQEHYPGVPMWFWSGGYGPHEYICSKCGLNLKGENDQNPVQESREQEFNI